MTRPHPTSRTGSRRDTAPAVSVDELHRQLTDAIATLETADQWQAWLDFARHLHRYSFNNLILIWAQRPDATAVASYRSWQALDRQVRRGEKAVRVLAPIQRRVPVTDEHGRPVVDADGQSQTRQQVTGFRPVSVFDITQTDGPPVPEKPQPVLLAGQAPAGLWYALVDEVSRHGYRLLRGSLDQLGGANGVTKPADREVWVRADVDDAQAVKTLTHELAHILLHTGTDQVTACAGIGEVEAESVAHLVMAVHGVATGSYTFPYVASWAYPLAAVEHVPMADIVARTGARVIQTANDILHALPAPADTAEPAVDGLTARVTVATGRAADLTDRAAASLLPPVDRAVLLGVVADSHDFFRRHVGDSWVPGYLAGRGLDSAIGSHHFGYAPQQWTALTDHLRSLGYTDDHIEAAGMATRARTGHLIDRFRDRLTIPLHDSRGDLVGFTARTAPDADDRAGPRYLNTPTTAIFRKAEILYGLDRSAPGSNRTAVVCEGPLDAVAVDLAAGRQRLPWVGVAASGTAFTDHHAGLLLAAAAGRPVVLAFDGDTAGHHAAEAAWRRLTDNAPYDVRIVRLPAGQDPASLAATHGNQLTQALDDARPAAQVVASRQIDHAHLDGHVARELTAFRTLSQYTSRIPVDQRADYLLGLAGRLRIDPGEAATIAVDQNPAILTDRILDHAHQLAALTRTTGTGDPGDDAAALTEHHHRSAAR